MNLPAWVAAVVLFLHLPIPLYWFVLHPGVQFWRGRQKAAYIFGLVCSWPPVTFCLVWFHTDLFRSAWAPIWRLVLGVALIVFEFRIFWQVHRDLGSARLVGKTELSGGGEIAVRGIYASIRHPRYAGSFIAILGASFLAGTVILWVVAAAWLLLMLLAIGMEEHEMRSRFGVAYDAYCRRVPRFIPMVISRRS